MQVQVQHILLVDCTTGIVESGQGPGNCNMMEGNITEWLCTSNLSTGLRFVRHDWTGDSQKAARVRRNIIAKHTWGRHLGLFHRSPCQLCVRSALARTVWKLGSWTYIGPLVQRCILSRDCRRALNRAFPGKQRGENASSAVEHIPTTRQ